MRTPSCISSQGTVSVVVVEKLLNFSPLKQRVKFGVFSSRLTEYADCFKGRGSPAKVYRKLKRG